MYRKALNEYCFTDLLLVNNVTPKGNENTLHSR